jgi:hypothetical protein
MDSGATACLNYRVNNCEGRVITRGNVYCDKCLTEQHRVYQGRRENNSLELIEKNRFLEEEISKYRIQLANASSLTEEQCRELISTEEKRQQQFASQLQHEIEQLTGKLSKEKITNQQLLIDREKLATENRQLLAVSKTLLEENKQLQEENTKLASLNENLISLSETQIRGQKSATKK